MCPLDLSCAPVEHLPDEILALIFKVEADLPLGRHERPVPLIISSVCKRWRVVALSSPEVWTTVRISARRSLACATVFLQRSTPLPFRLSINTETDGRTIDIAPVLDVLLPHVARCSGLALCLSDDDLCAWIVALQGQEQLRAVRLLSLTVHSYPPEELWGPPDSLFQFTGLFPALHSLRLSMGPAMHLREQWNALNLTTLDVRCTWDGAFVRHVCRHSRVLETLVLRGYSASVFYRAAPACLPSLTSLVLEYADAALAEGLVGLAMFLELPNLARLEIKGSHVPSVGYSFQSWPIHPFPRLRTLRLEDVVLERSIDSCVLQTLGARVTHLQVVNSPHYPFADGVTLPLGLPLAGFPDLRVLEIPAGMRVCVPGALRDTVSVRPASLGGPHWVAAEIGMYETTNGGADDFEHEERAHMCSDFCALHNQSPWRDTRSDAERKLDVDRGGLVRAAARTVSGGQCV
ncbi:hypothetical protein FB451DRAFT_1228350 [Mycena latifolia]|nr:hypothetical protein FB451DRAFT_1228350 [Mycena latifolia]